MASTNAGGNNNIVNDGKFNDAPNSIAENGSAEIAVSIAGAEEHGRHITDIIKRSVYDRADYWQSYVAERVN